MSEAISTPEAAAPAEERDRNLRKTRVGEVVSDAMDKTIVVSTTTRVPHKKFGKIIKHVKRFHVHDEKNEAKVGDRVTIMETRPLSRLKRWRLVEILKH
jgi:small subunit ribosomal protein S17